MFVWCTGYTTIYAEMTRNHRSVVWWWCCDPHLENVQILAAFWFGITCPHSAEQSAHLQAGRCSWAAIFARTEMVRTIIDMSRWMMASPKYRTCSVHCWAVCWDRLLWLTSDCWRWRRAARAARSAWWRPERPDCWHHHRRPDKCCPAANRRDVCSCDTIACGTNRCIRMTKTSVSYKFQCWCLVIFNIQKHLPWLFRILQLEADLWQQSNQQFVNVVVDADRCFDELALVKRGQRFALCWWYRKQYHIVIGRIVIGWRSEDIHIMMCVRNRDPHSKWLRSTVIIILSASTYIIHIRGQRTNWSEDTTVSHKYVYSQCNAMPWIGLSSRSTLSISNVIIRTYCTVLTVTYAAVNVGPCVINSIRSHMIARTRMRGREEWFTKNTFTIVMFRSNDPSNNFFSTFLHFWLLVCFESG